MATIAPGLNFRIGADVKGINKAIREAEKSLRGAVSSFSSIGNSLSLALSAPIAAFTGMSIKAAGDMESLRLALEGTMKDAGYSIGQAREELEALRVAALAPGLDFEQAVRGSIRLQSVGKSAEEAREIIVQLANALALSGGTADQLDGVTKQFTQMIGKGKIMQEDLTIILENMPALAKVMQDTFGSSNAEMLRDMGVSVEDFISGLTKGMKELPRAQGGIANAIVNANNAIKQSLASVGEEIDKTFNVSGALNDFSNWVSGLAQWFKGLSLETKQTIAQVAVFVATLGPAIMVTSRLAGAFGVVWVKILEMRKATALAGSAMTGFITTWKSMDVVMKATVIGGAISVIMSLVAATSLFSDKSKELAAEQARVRDSIEDVRKEAGHEAAALNANLHLLKSVNLTQEGRRLVIKQLQDQYPQYLGNIDLEKASLADLDAIQKRVNQSILESVAARKKSAMLESEFSKIADAKLRLAEIEKGGFDALTGEEVTRIGRSLFGTEFEKKFVMASARADAVRDVIKALTQDIEVANKTVGEIENSFASAFQTGQSVVGTGQWEAYYNGVSKGTKTIEKQKDSVNDLSKSYRELDKAQQLASRKEQTDDLKAFKKDVSPTITPGGNLPESVSSINDPFKGIADSARIATSAIQQNLTVAGQAAEMYRMVREGVDGLSTSMQAMAAAMISNGEVMQAIMLTVGDAIAQAGAQGAATFAEFTKAALGSAAKVIRAWIKMAVTRVALSALQNVPFPFNIAAAEAAGGLASGLFNALIKKVGIPALAEGGVLTGPQLVMAGEYPGARVNPEIVTPENKMRDVFAEVMRTSGGGGAMTLTTRISGDDLLFVLEKAKAKAARRR